MWFRTLIQTVYLLCFRSKDPCFMNHIICSIFYIACHMLHFICNLLYVLFVSAEVKAENSKFLDLSSIRKLGPRLPVLVNEYLTWRILWDVNTNALTHDNKTIATAQELGIRVSFNPFISHRLWVSLSTNLESIVPTKNFPTELSILQAFKLQTVLSNSKSIFPTKTPKLSRWTIFPTTSEL